MFETIRTLLLHGTHIQAMAILSAIATLTVLPVTLIRGGFSISIGYGASVTFISLALILLFKITLPLSLGVVESAPEEVLAYVTLLYGVRLTWYILLRYHYGNGMKDQIRAMDNVPRYKSISLAMILSILYACMVSPVFFALREGKNMGDIADLTQEDMVMLGRHNEGIKMVELVGVLLAFAGVVLETVADQHKYNVKRKHHSNYNGEKFVGPTGGAYALCRHPNFLGEVLFWVGVYLGGVLSFGKSITAWICATSGLWSIVSIMLGSTARLEKKQEKKYGGQPRYEDWKAKVKAPLFPFLERQLKAGPIS